MDEVVQAGDDERRCSRCGEIRQSDQFPIKSKATGARRTWCRDCCRAYSSEHYRQNRALYLAKAARRNARERATGRERLAEYLRQHPCIGCGETDIILLDFDHRDRTLKRGTVSRIVHTSGWSVARKEIENCDVRCANCHRRRTAEQLSWRKAPGRGALAPEAIALMGPCRRGHRARASR